MDVLYLVFGVFVFIAVVLLVEGAYLMWNTSKGPEAKRIARRLRLMSAGTSQPGEEVSILKSRLLSQTPAIERLLLQAPRIQHLDRLLEQSGVTWSVAELLGMMALSAVAGAAVALYFGMTLFLTSSRRCHGRLNGRLLFTHAATMSMSSCSCRTHLISSAVAGARAAFPSRKMVLRADDPIGGDSDPFDELIYVFSRHRPAEFCTRASRAICATFYLRADPAETGALGRAARHRRDSRPLSCFDDRVLSSEGPFQRGS